MQIDYNYLCHGLGHLTGLEVRIYQGDSKTEHYFNYEFKPDIVEIILPEIEIRKERVFYIETDELLVFGVIKSKNNGPTLIIGPTSQIRPGKQETISMLYRLGETYERLSDLETYFDNMIPYPFENFLEILCFVNYAINEEKLSVADLIRREDIVKIPSVMENGSNQNEDVNPHNTYEAEKIMLSYITTGDVDAVRAFFHTPPTGRIGPIAQNELRQRKNTHICAATLMSRAAIAGGMSPEAAFAISDRYIQKVELLRSGKDITALGMEMMLDYAIRVESLKCGSNDSYLARDIKRWIHKHFSEKISINDIASALGINRSYLCERFKQETGTTIVEFITSVRIDEAKRMLTVTSLTIAQISDYLAFSSQSYFQNVFKKFEGCTPREYRQRTQKS